SCPAWDPRWLGSLIQGEHATSLINRRGVIHSATFRAGRRPRTSHPPERLLRRFSRPREGGTSREPSVSGPTRSVLRDGRQTPLPGNGVDPDPDRTPSERPKRYLSSPALAAGGAPPPARPCGACRCRGV